MAISKITLNGVTQIDLTSDTVTAQTLVDDYVAHGADGNTVTGELVMPTARTASDVTVSGATVTIPSGAYSTQVQKSVASGTAGTPTASKGTVNNHSIAVTPSVTNSTGYITGSTINGTAVTVSASELVSGDKSITANGTNIDVTDYETVSVNVSGGGGTVKLGALRPDAELIKTWTYDQLFVDDLELTIPAYTTSQTSILASQNLSPTVNIDQTNYSYFTTMRVLITPVYSSDTFVTNKSKQAYYADAGACEMIRFFEGEYISGYQTTAVSNYFPYYSASRYFFLTSTGGATNSSLTTKYGIYSTITNPSVVSSTNDIVTYTAKSPAFYMRGSSTYFVQDYWDMLDDIRLQYVIDLWRVPISATFSGRYTWGSQIFHIVDCAKSQTGTLT